MRSAATFAATTSPTGSVPSWPTSTGSPPRHGRDGGALACRRGRRRPHGRRGREAAVEAARPCAGGGPDAGGDGSAPPGATEGRRARDRSDRGDHGRQADERVDPALSPASAVRGRRGALRRRRPSRDHDGGRDRRADGCRNGGTGGRVGRGADRLRHGQGDRLGSGRRRSAAAREDEGSGVRTAVLTVSDGVAAGEREDRSGDLLAELLEGDGYEVERRVVADDREAITAAIVVLTDVARLVLTTGGTGLGPRDVTPEATAEALDRPVPGIAEVIRADAAAKTPHGLLSRGLAGVRGTTLVVNLPGSTGGCRDGYAVIRPALEHALSLLAGAETAHRQTCAVTRSI